MADYKFQPGQQVILVRLQRVMNRPVDPVSLHRVTAHAAYWHTEPRYAIDNVESPQFLFFERELHATAEAAQAAVTAITNPARDQINRIEATAMRIIANNTSALATEQ